MAPSRYLPVRRLERKRIAGNLEDTLTLILQLLRGAERHTLNRTELMRILRHRGRSWEESVYALELLKSVGHIEQYEGEKRGPKGGRRREMWSASPSERAVVDIVRSVWEESRGW